MKTVDAQFDEIEHVHRIAANATLPRRTVFSFMQNFKYTPYVTIAGFPRLENGMKVTAVLREEGNWKSLVGWRDLETGDLAVPDPSYHRNRGLVFLGWGLLVMAISWPRGSSEPNDFVVPAIGCAIAALAAAVESRNWRRVKHDADSVRSLLSARHAA